MTYLSSCEFELHGRCLKHDRLCPWTPRASVQPDHQSRLWLECAGTTCCPFSRMNRSQAGRWLTSRAEKLEDASLLKPVLSRLDCSKDPISTEAFKTLQQSFMSKFTSSNEYTKPGRALRSMSKLGLEAAGVEALRNQLIGLFPGAKVLNTVQLGPFKGDLDPSVYAIAKGRELSSPPLANVSRKSLNCRDRIARHVAETPVLHTFWV